MLNMARKLNDVQKEWNIRVNLQNKKDVVMRKLKRERQKTPKED